MIILNCLKLLSELSSLEQEIAQREKELRGEGPLGQQNGQRRLLKKLIEEKIQESQ